MRLAAICLAALALRAGPWLANLPLHHDEALYGTWARSIAEGADPFLLTPWVDKPPLVPYLLALSIRLFGASEVALRLPGMLAGVFTVWATHGLAQRVTGEREAWLAAVLMTASPFAILFAPTAFTDGWLTLFIVAAAWAALARRPLWAGVLVGLACASKQQGVLGAPLVVALVVAGSLDCESAKADERRKTRNALSAVGLAVLGFAVVFGAVTWWDSLRWHNRPSYWDQSLRTYGGVVLAPLADWPRRAWEWAQQAGYLFGAWPISVAVSCAGLLSGVAPAVTGLPANAGTLSEVAPAVAGLPANAGTLNEVAPAVAGLPASAGTLSEVAPAVAGVPASAGTLSGVAPAVAGVPASAGILSGVALVVSAQRSRRMPERANRVSFLLLIYVLGYLLVHIAFTFQPWDRYLLPILPLVCVLCAAGLCRGERSLPSARRPLVRASLSLALLISAALGVTASIPVGSDIGAYRGVAEAAQFLAAQPPGTTVYYDRIGWHLGYYLYGKPVTRSWYDSPRKLASEVARVAAGNGSSNRPNTGQWLALPTWEEPQLPGLVQALRVRGFTAVPAYTVVGRTGAVELTLYRLEQRAHGDGDAS